MAVTHEISVADTVELTKPVDGIPAGTRGGVLELRDQGIAMVEITDDPSRGALDRIVFVPVSQLRVLS